MSAQDARRRSWWRVVANVIVGSCVVAAGCASGERAEDASAPTARPVVVGPAPTGLGLPTSTHVDFHLPEAITQPLDAAGVDQKPGPTPCSAVLTLQNDTIGFAFDSAALDPAGATVIARISPALGPARAIEIVGHTSTDGDETYNQALSERRSGVVAFVIVQGLPPTWPGQLHHHGAGESAPVIQPDDTEEARQRNRRVEITTTYPPDVCLAEHDR